MKQVQIATFFIEDVNIIRNAALFLTLGKNYYFFLTPQN